MFNERLSGNYLLNYDKFTFCTFCFTVNLMAQEIKDIDLSLYSYVLVYKPEDKHVRERTVFESAMQREGLLFVKHTFQDVVYIFVSCCFERLCFEAEKIQLKMPLIGLQRDTNDGWFSSKNDETVNDGAISTSFQVDKQNLFKRHDDHINFFRSSLRLLLIHNILINIDIDNELDVPDDLRKHGLLYLLHEDIYTDAYILHDYSAHDSDVQRMIKTCKENGVDTNDIDNGLYTRLSKDVRLDLYQRWKRTCSRQPLCAVRNYFGERIGFYFGWISTYIMSLIFPALFGVAVFIYGVYLTLAEANVSSLNSYTLQNASQQYNSSSEVHSKQTLFQLKNLTVTEKLSAILSSSLEVLKRSCDNDSTPAYAVVMCLWGTIFLEVWKRKSNTLAHYWDVTDYQVDEPDRPEFTPTKLVKDRVTGEMVPTYPTSLRMMKYFLSISFVITMLCSVFFSVIGVAVYRQALKFRWCSQLGATGCSTAYLITPSLLNAIFIMVLGAIYGVVARKLTDWENHRTQLEYDRAFIIKTFSFQFANSYASMFYIAFMQGRVQPLQLFGQTVSGDSVEQCDNNNCMTQLSFQVLVVLVVKGIPKFATDVVLPLGQRLWRWLVRWWERASNEPMPYFERERLKPKLGDFDRDEFTEKVLQYGYMMLFAASLPIGPLLIILLCVLDNRVDSERLLWTFRRPLAFQASDIGIWFDILQLLNLIGVVTNGFLIFFTSDWSDRFQDDSSRLWGVIIFEHCVFALKMALSYMVPDVPSEVALAARQERHFVSKYMSNRVAGSAAWMKRSEAGGAAAASDNDSAAGDKVKRRRKKKQSPRLPTSLLPAFQRALHDIGSFGSNRVADADQLILPPHTLPPIPQSPSVA